MHFTMNSNCANILRLMNKAKGGPVGSGWMSGGGMGWGVHGELRLADLLPVAPQTNSISTFSYEEIDS